MRCILKALICKLNTSILIFMHIFSVMWFWYAIFIKKIRYYWTNKHFNSNKTFFITIYFHVVGFLTHLLLAFKNLFVSSKHKTRNLPKSSCLLILNNLAIMIVLTFTPHKMFSLHSHEIIIMKWKDSKQQTMSSKSCIG